MMSSSSLPPFRYDSSNPSDIYFGSPSCPISCSTFQRLINETLGAEDFERHEGDAPEGLFFSLLKRKLVEASVPQHVARTVETSGNFLFEEYHKYVEQLQSESSSESDESSEPDEPTPPAATPAEEEASKKLANAWRKGHSNERAAFKHMRALQAELIHAEAEIATIKEEQDALVVRQELIKVDVEKTMDLFEDQLSVDSPLSVTKLMMRKHSYSKQAIDGPFPRPFKTYTTDFMTKYQFNKKYGTTDDPSKGTRFWDAASDSEQQFRVFEVKKLINKPLVDISSVIASKKYATELAATELSRIRADIVNARAVLRGHHEETQFAWTREGINVIKAIPLKERERLIAWFCTKRGCTGKSAIFVPMIVEELGAYIMPQVPSKGPAARTSLFEYYRDALMKGIENGYVDTDNPVLVFDFPRENSDGIKLPKEFYSVMERLKGATLYNEKHSGKMQSLKTAPLMVVVGNAFPPLSTKDIELYGNVSWDRFSHVYGVSQDLTKVALHIPTKQRIMELEAQKWNKDDDDVLDLDNAPSKRPRDASSVSSGRKRDRDEGDGEVDGHSPSADVADKIEAIFGEDKKVTYEHQGESYIYTLLGIENDKVIIKRDGLEFRCTAESLAQAVVPRTFLAKKYNTANSRRRG